jgi:transmembrane sensor
MYAVLGTSFNVQAYPDLKNTNVMVRTGKVQVSSKDRMLSEVTPNKELRFDRNAGSYRLMNSTTPIRDSWMSGVVVLDRATFQELSQTFYNMYGRQLTTKDRALLKDRYNITFRKSIQLKDMLEQILRLTEKNYTKKRGGQHSDSTLLSQTNKAA